MAQCTFQEQLFSVMEILAKAATEEINRRVADSCAVIRIELSRSQRDIDSLKRKCQVMENELRKVRGRGRRKGTKQVLLSTQKLDHSSLNRLLHSVFTDVTGISALNHVMHSHIYTKTSVMTSIIIILVLICCLGPEFLYMYYERTYSSRWHV